MRAVPENEAEETLKIMRNNELGKNTEIIGRAISDYEGKVILKSPYGSKRIMEPTAGELLPRIC